MKLCFRISCCLIFFLISGPGYTQQSEELAEYARQFSGQNAVMTRNDQHLTLSFQKGVLTGTSQVDRDILLISDKAPRLYNQYTIYHGYFHELGEVKAYTIIPDGKKTKSIKVNEIKTTNSETDNIFYDDGKETVLTYHGLEKGAITRLSYEMKHRDMHFLPTFYFQSYMPVASATYTVTVPKSVNLKYSYQGGATEKEVTYSKTENKGNVTHTWTSKNLKSPESFSNSPGTEYYVKHVLVYITDYTDPATNQQVNVLKTVDDLYRFYYSFIADINKAENPKLKTMVDGIIKNAKTDREKAAAIYKWVQDNIKYVAFEDGMGGFIPRDAGLVCDRRFGDCKDMSSLLVRMCQLAGLKAYFTWIGTRSKPYSYKETPLPIVDNHMICTVKLGDEYVFLDGTDPTIPFGHPPYSIQGKEALIGIDKTGYLIRKVPLVAAKENIVLDSTSLRLEGEKLVGHINTSYSGYPAWYINTLFLYRNANEKDKALEALNSRGNNKFNQISGDVTTDIGREKEAKMTSSFVLPDYYQKIGKELIVNLNLQRDILNDEIDPKKRDVPIEYDYMYQVKQIVSLDIPKGYQVTYLPPNQTHHEKNLWGYKINYSKTKDKVILEKEYEINTLYAQPEQFDAHLKMVNELKNHFRESIVLTADK